MPFSPTQWSPQRTSSVSRRLSGLYVSAPSEMKALGRQFYPVWSDTAAHIGEVTGTSRAHGAAVLAHLSPSNEAEMNRIQAIQLVHTQTPTDLKNLVEAGRHMAIGDSAEKRKRYKPEGSAEWKALHEEEQDSKSTANRLRGLTSVDQYATSGLATRELSNAARVLMGHHEEDPLGSLGELKIRDFGGAIHDPSYSRVPIDTHYHDAALGKYDIPYEARRGLQNPNRYNSFQRASSMAHGRILGMGIDIPHSEMMAGIWYNHQLNKARLNPDSAASRKASETKIRNIRGNPQFAHLLPESFGLVPSFPKIR